MATKTSHRRRWGGVLLSALVLPGLGQLHHGDRIRGIALILAALICLGLLFVRILKSVWSLAQILGYPSLSHEYIHMMTESVHREQGPFLLKMIILFLAIWFIGVVDAWIRAPRQDEE